MVNPSSTSRSIAPAACTGCAMSCRIERVAAPAPRGVLSLAALIYGLPLLALVVAVWAANQYISAPLLQLGVVALIVAAVFVLCVRYMPSQMQARIATINS